MLDADKHDDVFCLAFPTLFKSMVTGEQTLRKLGSFLGCVFIHDRKLRHSNIDLLTLLLWRQCDCKDPNYKPPTTPAPKCANEGWKGDGNCDDGNNNSGCEYDGGDCCASTVNNKKNKVKKKYCSKCECLDPHHAS